MHIGALNSRLSPEEVRLQDYTGLNIHELPFPCLPKTEEEAKQAELDKPAAAAPAPSESEETKSDEPEDKVAQRDALLRLLSSATVRFLQFAPIYSSEVGAPSVCCSDLASLGDQD